MTDRLTKILLGTIALGLWVNLFVPLVRPVTAVAQYETDYILKRIEGHLSAIALNIERLQLGSCANGKLCH
jgi:hypothetical protein